MDGVTRVIPRFDNKDGHMKNSEISGVPRPEMRRTVHIETLYDRFDDSFLFEGHSAF